MAPLIRAKTRLVLGPGVGFEARGPRKERGAQTTPNDLKYPTATC